MNSRQSRNSRGSARQARRAKRAALSAVGPPYITRRIPVYEMANEETLSLVENNAETVLEEIGIEFRDDQDALALFRTAGATINGERVRFPRGMCREIKLLRRGNHQRRKSSVS